MDNDSVKDTEVDSPDVIEISSDSEIEMVSAKMQPQILNPSQELLKMKNEERYGFYYLNPSQELLKMKNEERYGFYYRLQDRQAQIDEKLSRVRKEIAAEKPEDRQARRKSFRKHVLGFDD